jgi:hypothetical protein
MFSAVIRAETSATSSTSRRPGHARSICSASLGPPAGDQPLNTTTRGRRRSARRAASSMQAWALGPMVYPSRPWLPLPGMTMPQSSGISVRAA